VPTRFEITPANRQRFRCHGFNQLVYPASPAMVKALWAIENLRFLERRRTIAHAEVRAAEFVRRGDTGSIEVVRYLIALRRHHLAWGQPRRAAQAAALVILENRKLRLARSVRARAA